MNRINEVLGRLIIISVVVSAIIYKRFHQVRLHTSTYVKEHQAVEETLTVAMFTGMIGLVMALAIPGSHVLVAVIY